MVSNMCVSLAEAGVHSTGDWHDFFWILSGRMDVVISEGERWGSQHVDMSDLTNLSIRQKDLKFFDTHADE
jgi:hypothetical protein